MADIRIRWLLDVSDRGAGQKLLRQDREIRRSIEQTDRQWAKAARDATSASAKQAAASQRVEHGVRGVGHAAAPASEEVRRYAAAQREALTIGSRLVSQSGRVEQAYRRQGRAAEQLSARERAAARAQKTSASAVRGAARGGAGLAGLAGGVASRAGSSLGLGGGFAATLGLAAAGRQTIEFDRALRNVNSIAQLSEKHLQAVGKSLRDLGGKTAQSPKSLAEGMYDLVSSGFNAKQSLLILRSSAKAATAGLTDTATSTKTVAAVLNAYRLPASAASEVSDTLFQTVNRGVVSFGELATTIGDVLPFAASLHVPLTQVGAALSTMTKQGLSGAEASTRLKNAMITFIKPGEAMATAIKATGYSSGEALIKAKGFQGALEAVIGTTKGSKSDTAGMFRNIRAIGGALALTGNNAKTAHGDLAAFAHITGATDKALDQQARSASYQWNKLKATVSGLSIELGNKLLPAANRAIGAFLSLANPKTAGGGLIKSIGAGLGAGLRGQPLQGRLARTGGGAGGVEREDPSKVAQIGVKIGQVARTVGQAAATAGKQLLDAFKPALPFFQNILLPLLIGVGKGVLSSVVAAFKILIPIIRVTATVLGAIGKVARPFRGVIEGIGVAIGFLASGPILKLLGGLGKIGVVFKVLGAPVRIVTELFGLLGRGLLKIPGALVTVGRVAVKAGEFFAKIPLKIAGLYGKVWIAAGRLAIAAGKGLAKLPARLAVNAASAGAALVGRLAGFAGKVEGAAIRLVGRAARPFASLGHAIAEKARGALGDILGFFGRIGKSIIRAIVNAIKAAPGAIVDAIKSVVPGPLRKVASKIPGNPLGFRRGGRVRRFQGGGLVDAMVSPGEAVLYGNEAWMVPGHPTAADSVYARLPVGAAVLTGDGQRRMGAGASLTSALASQAPHFRAGGVVAGSYAATAYGPPWGGIQGTGTTATGVDLRRSPHLYGIAVDPAMIPLGAQVYAQPNPFGRSGPFRAFDTGGAIKGRRVDFYDWRGRGAQNQWGRRDVRISPSSLSASSAGGGDGATAHIPIVLGRSRTRAGLVGDALSQGIDAGASGLTRREIALAGLGARGARVNPIIEAIRGAQSATRRDVKVPGSRGGRLPSGVYVPSGTFNPQRKPIARWIVPYLTYGASHGWSGVVTSGYRDPRVKVTPGRGLPVAPQGQSNHNRTSYPGGAVDVTQAARLAAVLRKRPGARLLQWAGAKDPVHFSHPTGGRYRTGGIVGRAAAGAALPSLDIAIGAATDARLESMRRAVVTRVRAGGDKRLVQRLQGVIDLIDFEVGRRIGALGDAITRRTARLDRAQGAVDRGLRRAGIDADTPGGLGRQGFFTAMQDVPVRQQNVAGARDALRRAQRTGSREAIRGAREQLAQAQDDLDEALTKRIETSRQLVVATSQDVIDRTSRFLERGRAQLDRQMRVAGTDAGSARGLDLQGAADQVEVGLRKHVVDSIESSLRATSDPGARSQLTEQLDQARDDLDEAFTVMVEHRRQAIAAAAQERVDAAQFGLDVSQANSGAFDVQQRASRSADTAGGMLERASLIQATILPALTAQRDALTAQQADLASIGDGAGVRQAFLAAQQASTELASAMQDAADLIRQAANQVVQDRVDAARFRVDIAQSNATAFELSQRLGRTDQTGSGMRERAGFIQRYVAPELAHTRDALQAQADQLRTTGSADEFRQATLAARQAANDYTQALIDAADLLRQATTQDAQDRADTAQYNLDVGQTYLSALDVGQRLARTAETEAGMREKAAQIQSQIIPLIAGQRDALYAQYNALTSIGDLAGARQAWLSAQQAANDLGTAMADAADLIRQAASQEAQNRVDAAEHASTMVDLDRQRVELEQRIAGTFDTGGQARGDYIRNQVIPALEQTISALSAQADVARQQGDPKLADQIAESIAGKRNEQLQAILDATEQTAENTQPRKVGGALGFSYGNETLTDVLIGVGNG